MTMAVKPESVSKPDKKNHLSRTIYPIWQKPLYQMPESEYISYSMVNLSMSVSYIKNSLAIQTQSLSAHIPSTIFILMIEKWSGRKR